jgi:hypothetical protein
MGRSGLRRDHSGEPRGAQRMVGRLAHAQVADESERADCVENGNGRVVGHEMAGAKAQHRTVALFRLLSVIRPIPGAVLRKQNLLHRPRSGGLRSSDLIHLSASAAIAMSNTNQSHLQRAAWLRKLYFIRAAFSFAWVALAFTVAKGSPVVASGLLIVYPAWDALANLLDARMTGGAKANPTQVLNAWMSALVTVAVAASLALKLQVILAIFGVWADRCGPASAGDGHSSAQRRSGAVGDDAERGAVCVGWRIFCGAAGECGACRADLRGYAAVGAVYFLISGLVILIRQVQSQGRWLGFREGLIHVPSFHKLAANPFRSEGWRYFLSDTVIQKA